MPRERYQDSLDELRSDVLAMGDQVVGRLDRSLEAIERRDESLAREVVDGDAEINETYLRLETAVSTCSRSSSRSPATSGSSPPRSRSSPTSNGSATSPSTSRTTRGPRRGPSRRTPRSRRSGRRRALLERSLAAYETRDADECRAIAEADDEVDAMCQHASESVTRDLIAQNDDAWGAERLLDDVSRVLLTIRDLERVADHAVNIAARTLYMVENDPGLLY